MMWLMRPTRLRTRVKGIGGVVNRAAAVVKLVHRGDLRADVAELLLAHAARIAYRIYNEPSVNRTGASTSIVSAEGPDHGPPMTLLAISMRWIAECFSHLIDERGKNNINYIQGVIKSLLAALSIPIEPTTRCTP